MKAVADNDQDFAEASYNSDGVVVPTGWSDLDADAVAAGAPWRKFAWYLGQQSYSGVYWSATGCLGGLRIPNRTSAGYVVPQRIPCSGSTRSPTTCFRR
jgi:hypothetical protein